MYLSNSQYIDNSKDAVQIIGAAKNIYESSIAFIGSFFTTLVAYVIGIPLMKVVLYFVHRTLKANFTEIDFTSNNISHYIKIRKSYDLFSDIIQEVNVLKSDLEKIKSIPFGFKGLIDKIYKILNLILSHYSDLKDYISKMDYNSIKTSSFEYISEDVLWNKRTKAYKYKL